MHSVLLRPSLDNRDRLLEQLWELGTCGILEEDDTLRAFFPDAIDISSLSYVAPVIETRIEDDSPHYAFSHENWEPLLVGTKFFLTPSWLTAPTPPGRFRLSVDSVTAFGTGRHETTQLALEWLETLVRRDQMIVDIGCGSGILAAAARLLGCRNVIACDIDALAVEAAANELQVKAFIGSADAIRSHDADLLLVNISAKVIDTLAPELKRLLKPEAHVLLTGFIEENPPVSFTPADQREQNGWLCWLGTAESFHTPEALPGQQMAHATQWW